MSFSLQEAQDDLAILVNDTSTPDEGSEEWDQRTNLLGQAVRRWEAQEGVRWRELYTTADLGTTDGTTTAFALPDDFRELTGYVLLSDGDSWISYEVIPPQKAHTYANDTAAKYAYLAGDQLTFVNAPATGSTIRFIYYKTATRPAAAADLFEMSDPQYALYLAAAELARLSDDYAGVNYFRQLADEALEGMKTRNEALPYYQTGDAMPDASPGFGY